MSTTLVAIGQALGFAFAMFWEILWALVLGFALSAVVQAVVSKREMARLLPDDSPKSLAIATLLGAASSSCSYAAVALARSIFRKGANFTAAIAFEFASTNLVIELGIIMILLLGWQFAAAEFVGGLLMIAIVAALFKVFLRRELVQEARQQAQRGLVGSMEGHAEMDMAVTEGTLLQRITSPGGFTAMSHYFVMDWAAIWRDIAGGLLIAGALMAWVPKSFWQGFFLVTHPVAAYFWGPIVGPIVAMLSFVCSIGNVPLAAVLWNGGISFGGVISFIFADLIVLPILNIYRKYYWVRMMLFLLATSYAAMVSAGLVVELAFMALGLVPRERAAEIVEPHITLNYTTVLNIVFLALAAILLVRFFRTNGPAMLRMMNSPPAGAEHAGHGEHGRDAHAKPGDGVGGCSRPRRRWARGRIYSAQTHPIAANRTNKNPSLNQRSTEGCFRVGRIVRVCRPRAACGLPGRAYPYNRKDPYGGRPMRVPRLSETEILIASAISGKELYGLQIIDEVLALTRGKRRISLGGLYTTLHRMERKKLVTSRWGETVDDRQGARRRYYKIAGLGARALSETERVLGPALRLALGLSG